MEENKEVRDSRDDVLMAIEKPNKCDIKVRLQRGIPIGVYPALSIIKKILVPRVFRQHNEYLNKHLFRPGFERNIAPVMTLN